MISKQSYYALIVEIVTEISIFFAVGKSNMEGDMQATFDNCNNFNTKLQDTLKGLINANADRKSEIDSLRNDHEDLKKVLSIFNPKIQIFQMKYICSALVLHSPDFFLYLGSRIISNKRRKRK